MCVYDEGWLGVYKGQNAGWKEKERNKKGGFHSEVCLLWLFVSRGVSILEAGET